MTKILNTKNSSLKKITSEAVSTLNEEGVVVIRNLFKPESIKNINKNWKIYFKNPSISGALGYFQTSHNKRTLNPFLLGKEVIDISINKTIINIIESFMKSPCTLAEANAVLDKPSSYEYFPLHSDFAVGWKKSTSIKKALTKNELKNPIGVGVIMYLHNTKHGCFMYSSGSHKLLSPFGQNLKHYPDHLKNDIKKNLINLNGIAGDIILFDDRGFHGPAQPSKAERRVLIFDYYRNKTFGSIVVKPHEVKINNIFNLTQKQLEILGMKAKHMVQSQDYVYTRFKKNYLYDFLVFLIKNAYVFQHIKKLIKNSLLKVINNS